MRRNLIAVGAAATLEGWSRATTELLSSLL